MTNRERINTMSNQELAEYICRSYAACVCCPGYHYCVPNTTPANGVVKWLESDADEES